MRDCVTWPENGGPAFYQLETGRNLVKHHWEAVKGPRRLGKTTDAALLTLWFSLTRDMRYDWKVLITAGVGRQVTRYFWPEVHRWARRLKWDVVGRDPFDPRKELQLQSLHGFTGEAFGAVSDQPDLIEGVGAPEFLVILDEAKSIHPAVFDTLEAAMVQTADSTSYALALSTPGKPSGRLYEIFSKKAGFEHWHTTSVTIADAIKAGRRTQAEVDRLANMWGTNSVTYRAFVLGEFAADDDQSVIKLAHVEAAIERGYQWREDGMPGRIVRLGVDVGQSHDQTVLAPLYDHEGTLHLDNLIYYGPEDASVATMVTAGRVASFLQLHDRKPQAVIDSVGIGAGVYHRVREMKYKAVGFNAGASTKIVDRSGEFGFVNKRSAAWWGMGQYLDPIYKDNVSLPDDDLLIGDLTAPTWQLTSGGKIAVETKEQIKQRLGRSTDSGDGTVQAFWYEPTGVLFA